jgi:integrase
MSVRQRLSILFYLKGSKKSSDGKIPIYVRVTIDGLKDVISTGCKVLPEHWHTKTKQVLPADKSSKQINKKLGQIKADLERKFDLMQAKHTVATPDQVIESYQTPINGQQLQNEKVLNLAFSEALDKLIDEYIKHSKKIEKAYRFDAVPSPEKKLLLEQENSELREVLKALVKQANAIIGKKEHVKTFVLAIDEYLLNFLQLVFASERAYTSFEKMIGRKRQYIEFFNYRFKKSDISLNELEYQFIVDLYNYLLTHHGVNGNTASKYAQTIKEITYRVLNKGWIKADIFANFECKYVGPDAYWLQPSELEAIQNHVFGRRALKEAQDILLFCSYTGFSYQEVYDLSSSQLKVKDDGEIWASIDRQKTGNLEPVPLLPTALRLIERYTNHPLAIRRNRLFPVPTNQAYNRCLNEIAIECREKLGIKIDPSGHDARYYFANEVTYNNGVALKTVSKMLGHKSIKTTERYVRANESNISESMKMVKEKLFTKDGELKSQTDILLP